MISLGFFGLKIVNHSIFKADIAKPYHIAIDIPVDAVDSRSRQPQPFIIAFYGKSIFKRNAVVKQQIKVFQNLFGVIAIKRFQNIFKTRLSTARQVHNDRQTPRAALFYGLMRVIDFFVGINKSKIAVFGSIERFGITFAVAVKKIIFLSQFQKLQQRKKPGAEQKQQNGANSVPEFRCRIKHIR